MDSTHVVIAIRPYTAVKVSGIIVDSVTGQPVNAAGVTIRTLFKYPDFDSTSSHSNGLFEDTIYIGDTTLPYWSEPYVHIEANGIHAAGK